MRLERSDSGLVGVTGKPFGESRLKVGTVHWIFAGSTRFVHFSTAPSRSRSSARALVNRRLIVAREMPSNSAKS